MRERVSQESSVSIIIRPIPAFRIRLERGEKFEKIFLPGPTLEKILQPSSHNTKLIGVLGLGSRCRSGVDVDHEEVGRFAALKLFEKGYPSLLAVGVDGPWSYARLRGFEMESNRLGTPVRIRSYPISQLPTRWECDPTASFFKSFEKLISDIRGPMGIFVVADHPAASILRYLKKLARKVPEEFGVLGVNDDPFASLGVGGSLSSIKLPFSRLGYEAVDIALSGKKRIVRLGPLSLVSRASTSGFVTEDRVVREAQEWVEQLPGQRLSVEKLCAHLGVSRMHLQRHFQKALGMPFFEYQQGQRLDLARKLLEDKSCPVENAARQAGWETPRTFIRLFTRRFGKTPGVWQRENGMDRRTF